MPQDLAKEVRPRLKRTGEGALRDVKSNASWSTRIPGATRISVRFSKKWSGVGIVTNKNKAPHARPIENAGNTGTFRHPVFGTDRWVTQEARPFQAPAAEKWHASADEEIGKVVDEVIRPYGFR